MFTHEMRSEAVALSTWETWTNNGQHGDYEDTWPSVQDAVNNAYTDGIDDVEWWKASLRLLGHTGYPLEEE